MRVRKLCSEIFNRNRLPAEPMRVKGKPPIFPQPECQSRVAATQNITAHIPDPGQHTRRSYGAYCNRARVTAPAAQGKSDRAAQARSAGEDSEFARETRRTWTRLLRKIFEADPLLCSCGAAMKMVSIITQPRIVDRILRHLRSDRCQARDPFEPRAPPRAAAFSLQ